MRTRLTTALVALALGAGAAGAQFVAPVYNSLPGATNTLYLDFGGFSYNGTWAGKTPGVVPAYAASPMATSFSAQDIANIQAVCARVAEKYAPFDINVTTVDPARAANPTATDAQRQTFYGNTPNLMHTIIGGSSSWYGNAGGVSRLGVFGRTFGGFEEVKTNWAFPAQLGGTGAVKNVAEAVAHENGHALGLNHQSTSATANDYRLGVGPNGATGDPPFGATGPGSVAPAMGVAYYAERGVWSNGACYANGPAYTDSNGKLVNARGDGTGVQKDIKVIVQTGGNGVSLRDDGVGHSAAAATALQLSGTQILASANKGFIVPVDADVSAFKDDYFKFTATGLTRAVLNLGVPDGATLDGTLTILDSAGHLVKQVATVSLGESLTLDLDSGDYFAVVSSAGQYGDMGSFTLSGSLTPVPEPATVLLAAGAGLAVWRRRQAGVGLAA